MLWIRNEFFRIRILLFSWFWIAILFRILHEFFYNILNINFTLVFPSCKCGNIFIKRNLYFLRVLSSEDKNSKKYCIGRTWYRYRTALGYGSEDLDPCQNLFRSWIHWVRIRIQHFRLNTDPDPIRIQGFDGQKLKKIYSWMQKLQFTYP